MQFSKYQDIYLGPCYRNQTCIVHFEQDNFRLPEHETIAAHRRHGEIIVCFVVTRHLKFPVAERQFLDLVQTDVTDKLRLN